MEQYKSPKRMPKSPDKKQDITNFGEMRHSTSVAMPGRAGLVPTATT